MLQGQATSPRGTDRVTPRVASVPVMLSPRQRQVLGLLAEGMPAREIAGTLGIAEATVRNHIRLILSKLGCHSQLQAVAVAIRLNLIRRAPAGSPTTADAEPPEVDQWW